jgi:hypothetical protein
MEAETNFFFVWLKGTCLCGERTNHNLFRFQMILTTGLGKTFSCRQLNWSSNMVKPAVRDEI